MLVYIQMCLSLGSQYEADHVIYNLCNTVLSLNNVVTSQPLPRSHNGCEYKLHFAGDNTEA